MMLRNIPCSVTQEELEKVIHEMGLYVHIYIYMYTCIHVIFVLLGLFCLIIIVIIIVIYMCIYIYIYIYIYEVCEAEPARLQGGRVAQLSQNRKARRGGPSP